MANEVYANGREVSCKAADGKSICAFPDVCLTPPPPPAGFIPVPYPNTGFATDTSNGSRTVSISGMEVMLKDKSFFRKSTGDEAATRSTPMGVLTHTITGKVFFTSWSMDVKIEGENVARTADLTTHNHMSKPGNTPPWPYVDEAAIALGGVCHDDAQRIKKACNPESNWRQNCPTPPRRPAGARPTSAAAQAKWDKDQKRYMREFSRFAAKCEHNECLRSRKCMLVPYKPKSGCCPGQTGDHLIDAASFLEPDSSKPRNARERLPGWENYDVNKAPVVCAEGPNQTTATHGQLHTRKGVAAVHMQDKDGMWSTDKAATVGAKAHGKVFPSSGCDPKCIEHQLQYGHQNAATTHPPTKIKASASMTSDKAERASAMADMGVPSAGPVPEV